MSTSDEHDDPAGAPPPRRTPIHLAFEAGSGVPRLIDEIVAVADRRRACALEQARSVLGGLGLLPRRPTQVRPAPAVAAPPPPAAATTEQQATAVEPGPPVDELPIPSYDSLSASQVVPRLASLASDELELLRRYEAAGRARRTILNRIAQLQSA